MQRSPALCLDIWQQSGLIQSLLKESRVVSCRLRWAVGVLIYEMVAGVPPFYHDDRVVMFRNICHLRFAMPPHFSKVCAVRQLVEPYKAHANRIGL